MVAEQPPQRGGGTPRADEPGEALLSLIREPYVSEILAVLDDQPHSLTGLRRATGSPRRLAIAALRALAAHRAVAQEPAGGSWDTIDDERVRFRLTPTGRKLIEHVFQLDSWWSTYAMYPPFFE
ncbi:hypothetical protein GCM10023322_72710 [Rugosimonospora acidiphila]|uniref:Uncharacterized protein n=1 Tax=Rugosimonospora acidiphila TaxID=556531 RepID=A0ABP9SP42_9ACTN